jgi:hypothetical protein
MGREWITLGELYGLTDLLINFDHDLYKSIGVHEVYTLNLKNISPWSHRVKIFKTNILVYKKIRVPS